MSLLVWEQAIAMRAAMAGLMLVLGQAAPAASVPITSLEPAARSGDREAAFRLGRAYKLGEGVSADAGQAARWLERAAQLGHPKAGGELGLVLFQDGKGAAALPWLRGAADQGDARAQYALGTIYYAGQLVPADAAMAKRWMRRAAKAGLPAAAEALAIMDKPLAPLARAAQSYEIVTVGAPVSKPPAAAAVSGWQAQIGAFAVTANARRFWRDVKGEMGPEFRASFVPDGELIKLRVAPFGSKDEAARFCAGQRKRGRDCFELKGRG